MEASQYDLNQLALHIHFVLDKVTYPDWQDIRNLVNVHSLYWIQAGKGTFLTNTEHKVQAGMLVYLKPGLEMSMRSDSHDPLRIMMILFDCAELVYDAVWKDVAPIKKLSLPFLSHYNPRKAEALNLLFQEINKEWAPGVAAGAIVSQAKLSMLLHTLHRTEQADWSLLESGAFAAFEMIKKHLENGYKEKDLKIEQLTKEYSISPSYLRKLFLKYTGMGPKEYQIHLRNQQACLHLKYTDYPMREIANLCGYHEEYHFSKMFKQLNGVSPSAYRMMQRSGNHEQA